MKHGFLKIAAITPKMRLGDIEYNAKQIISNIIEAHTLTAQVVVFPELCICGKDICDMSDNPMFLSECERALKKITEATKQRDIVCFVGFPLRFEGNIYNAIACISKGIIYAINIKNDLSKKERAYFSPFVSPSHEIEVGGFVCPISCDITFSIDILNIAVCQSAMPNFANLKKKNINLALIIDSQAETAENYNNNFFKYASKQYSLGVLRINGGVYESTATKTYLPKKELYECGETLFSVQSYSKEIAISDIDIERIEYINGKNSCIAEKDYSEVVIDLKIKKDYEELDRTFEKYPFVLKTALEYEKMLKILSTAIYCRVKHTGAESLVIGVSGGLDSTATLLVVQKFCEMYEFNNEDVLCLTLPSFATSEQTFSNAGNLIKELGFTHKNISIADAVKAHLVEIDHDMTEDITYENAQARERTKILLNLANMTGGLMLGTSDMSEEALGFSTFGGDQISMLNVISGICKTTIKGFLQHYIDNTDNVQLQKLLINILDTPISPELKKGQKTEAQIGNYEIHDFILYNFLGNGYSKEKILYLMQRVFEEYSIGELQKILEIFFSRFFANQFKRNATSDGTQIFDISLSAGNFYLPSDFCGNAFKE